MSDDMAGKNRSGTWEAFAGRTLPKIPLGHGREKSPFIRKRKRGKPVMVADGVVVPMKFWKQDRGKGSC